MRLRALAFGLTLTCAASADQAPSTARRRAPAPSAAPTNLRARVGTEHAARLIRGDAEDRLRGIERAAAIGTPEAVNVLVEALEREPGPRIKADTRALLAMARALARFADQDRARAGLLAVVSTGASGTVLRVPSASRAESIEETDPSGRAELARQTAAIALARNGGDRALEALYGVVRGSGSGQTAGLIALALHPPRDLGFFGTTGASMPAPVVRMLGQLGDLRAIELLHAVARSADVTVRSAAIVALAELGDMRASLLARTAIAESDVRLRAASGEAFILLGAPERFKATSAIIEDDATTMLGLRMAERVHNDEITKLVAARAHTHPDRETRKAAIRALGRSPLPEAAKALVAPPLLGDRELAYEALVALARSPAPNAGALVEALFPTRLASLAARAYVVRASVRGERSSRSDAAVARLAGSASPKERALGVFVRIALGQAAAADHLADADVHVRRAAAAAAAAGRLGTRMSGGPLLVRLERETDPVTQKLLAVGLVTGDPGAIVKTSTLVDRAESGGADAPLAAFALGRRSDDALARTVGQLLSSKDGVLRAHVARGLATSTLSDATGRLADAYTYETDPEVRRAIIAGLAARTADARAPSRIETLSLAADLDPDGLVRLAARRATEASRTSADPTTSAVTPIEEVAWLRLTLDGGNATGDPFVGSIVRSDGLAVPILFDEDGHGLALGLPPGEARLVLAPRLPKDEAARKP